MQVTVNRDIIYIGVYNEGVFAFDGVSYELLGIVSCHKDVLCGLFIIGLHLFWYLRKNVGDESGKHLNTQLQH